MGSYPASAEKGSAPHSSSSHEPALSRVNPVARIGKNEWCHFVSSARVNENSTRNRVLVVDDQASVRALMELELQRVGFTVATAATGNEALRFLDDCAFDVVILDLILKEMDGLELLDLIRERHPSMPVVMLTGAGYTPEIMAEALARGADGYVSKGLSISNLVMELHRVLGIGKKTGSEPAE
jgi:DNA-binding response OmpR family regulator